VSERLVGFRHPVDVLFLPNGSALAATGFQQLAGQSVGHGLSRPSAGELYEPTARQRIPAPVSNLDRHLVGRATDAATANLQHRPGVRPVRSSIFRIAS
jgi:hypothetical protein